MDKLQFDRVAPFYDRLANFVFGKSLVMAQSDFLDKIPSSAYVLAVGGGSGSWIKRFLRTHPDSSILYVEPSRKMIELAMKNTGGDERIRFIHGTMDSIGNEAGFDAVLTFFVLDLFSDSELSDLIASIKGLVRARASWLVSDFVDIKWWHRSMLFFMYLFFRITVNLRTGKLPGWRACMENNGFVERQAHSFYGGFIRSIWYEAGYE